MLCIKTGRVGAPTERAKRREQRANFVRYAQHNINWIATRRLRSLAMTLFFACVACGLASLPHPALRLDSLRVKRSNPVNKAVRHRRTHSLLFALCALLSFFTFLHT